MIFFFKKKFKKIISFLIIYILIATMSMICFFCLLLYETKFNQDPCEPPPCLSAAS